MIRFKKKSSVVIAKKKRNRVSVYQKLKGKHQIMHNRSKKRRRSHEHEASYPHMQPKARNIKIQSEANNNRIIQKQK